MVTADQLDDLIINRLRADGRRSLRVLAEEAAVRESTVAARIRRLNEDGILRVTAVMDLTAAGFPYQVFCFIRVKGRAVADVAADLAAIEETLAVFIAFGEYDLIVTVRARDLDHVGELVHHRLGVVDGVERLDTDLCLDVRRYYPDVAVLTE